MRLHKVIQPRIRRSSEALDFVVDVNAAISANVGERSSTSHVSSHSSVSAQAGAMAKKRKREERRARGHRAFGSFPRARRGDAADPDRPVDVAEGRVDMGKEHEYKQLTREELNKLAGEELPERAAMSLINANVAAPINAATAANILSDDSIAYANAQQTGNIIQST